MPPDPWKATEARAQYAAERAVDDPVRLRQAARIFRVALSRGLVDRDGNVIDIRQARRDRAAEAAR
jgi:hypothetical protein